MVIMENHRPAHSLTAASLWPRNLTMENQLQPIETAPKGLLSDSWIIAGYEQDGIMVCFMASWIKGEWWYLRPGSGWYKIQPNEEQPTHWMPLPKPPTSQPPTS